MRRFVVLAVLASAAVAHAQAAVEVEVRSPDGTAAEGRVVLAAEGGASYRCETHGGHCAMTGVSGGRYVVRLEPRDGSEAPEPRVVVIPPSGSVTLRVSTH